MDVPTQLGLMFQSDTLLPWARVIDNVSIALELRMVPRAERGERAAELLRLVGLSGFERHFPSKLSGGMRKRAQLAQILAYDPAILLMDEPFGALDEQTRLLMGEWLLSIWTRARKTVVFVTHSLQEALFLSTRVVALTARPGRVKSVLEVPLPYPRDLESPGLASLRAKLWGEIRAESLKTMGR